MTEAGRGASPIETLCQQAATLTRVVQVLQERYLQLEGKLQHFMLPSAFLDPGSSSTNLPATAFSVLTLPPEPRVPTPERLERLETGRNSDPSRMPACYIWLCNPVPFPLRLSKLAFLSPC